jgi:hypothetical protein
MWDWEIFISSQAIFCLGTSQVDLLAPIVGCPHFQDTRWTTGWHKSWSAKPWCKALPRARKKLDAFSGWMLTAFGALLAFLLGKISDLAPYLDSMPIAATARGAV